MSDHGHGGGGGGGLGLNIGPGELLIGAGALTYLGTNFLVKAVRGLFKMIF